MKKLVKVLTFALCLPFATVAFSSCSEDDEEPQTETTSQNNNQASQDNNQGNQNGNQDNKDDDQDNKDDNQDNKDDNQDNKDDNQDNKDDDQDNQGTQTLTGTLFTLDGAAVTNSTLEFAAIPNPELLALGFTEIKACTTPLEGTSNHLKVTNATNSNKNIKVIVTLLQEKPASILNISWCGIEQGCADIKDTTPVVRQTTLAANASADLELDAIFTEGTPESCSLKVELEVEGQAKETITVKFVYNV